MSYEWNDVIFFHHLHIMINLCFYGHVLITVLTMNPLLAAQAGWASFQLIMDILINGLIMMSHRDCCCEFPVQHTTQSRHKMELK